VNLNLILVLLMLFALLLSMISLIMVTVCLLKTNIKMKNFFKSLRFCYLNNFIERGLKKNANQYRDMESSYRAYSLKKPARTINRLNFRNLNNIRNK